MKKNYTEVFGPMIVGTNDHSILYTQFNWLGAAKAVGFVILSHRRRPTVLGMGFAAESREDW